MIFDQKRLLSYFPLIATAALGALNDNLLKAAIIVFAAMSVPADEAATIGLLAGGLLMLPFILFSGWAGILADRVEKARMIRVVKWGELALACGATAAMATGNIPVMLCVVFLMGTQSAFFGPLKLGWLPERLGKTDLVTANSWMDTSTFLAILGGTVAGGLLAGPQTLIWTGAVSIVLALTGLGFAYMLPAGRAAAPEASVPLNPLSGNWQALRALFADKASARAALLDAWFWAAGSIYLSTLPAFLRQRLDGGEAMLTAVMALFAIGIGAGAFTASRKLSGEASPRLLLPSGLLIAAAAFGLYSGFDALAPGAGMSGLLATPAGLAVSGCLFLIAFGGGMFAVPLKAFIQSRADAGNRARVMGGFNLVSSLAIVCASGAMSLGVAAGLDLSHIFLGIAVTSLGAILTSVIFFPREVLQGFGRMLLKTAFRVEIEGEEHLQTKGPVVFVANHVSFADGPLLFSLIDREVSIAVNTDWAKGRLLGRLVKALNISALDPQRPMAAKGLAQDIRDGGAALVFPEGRISTHGALMKVYPGTAWLVDAAQAPVVAIHIEGLESSRWTRAIPGLRRSLFPKVRVRVSAPQRLAVPSEVRGKARREIATRELQSVLEESRMRALCGAQSIPHAFHEAAKALNPKGVALCDALGTNLTRGKITVGAAAFSHALQKITAPGEHVGVLLPGVAAAPIVLFGLWRAGRVAAILNPTLGPAPMLSAIETASIRKILTSRAFIEKAGLEDLVAGLEGKGIQILWTDDIKEGIGTRDKIAAMRAARRPADTQLSGDDPAVILFTSGTEGAPKGVVLSHRNLVGNVAQLRARADISASDRVLNALPLFHSFGLTAGVLLPLFAGAPVMLYPSPLHYRIVPEMAYAHNATLVFGTDTFLSGWGRRASPYDFATVRAAIAGAEAVKDSTRAMWNDKFGVRILEGYGATEAGPVIALNTPMRNQAGTVGTPLPGIETRLEDAPGIDGKRLWVRGPNVMTGYLLHGDPDRVHAPEGGWYDTGDIVDQGEDGFIRIVGRAKRFAKVGGEMVSLAAAEALAAAAWPESHVAAVSAPDARKGEKVLLITTEKGAGRKALSEAAKARGMAEIIVPSEVLVLDKIPLLASGKIDYPALTRQLAESQRAAA